MDVSVFSRLMSDANCPACGRFRAARRASSGSRWTWRAEYFDQVCFCPVSNPSRKRLRIARLRLTAISFYQASSRSPYERTAEAT